MTTDPITREDLEMAAKAAGLEVEWREPAPSPVQEALRMLDQCIDDLAFTINAIDDRTHSARLPTTSEDVAEVPKAHQSQLVGQIKTMRDRVYALNSHARTILDTLEL